MPLITKVVNASTIFIDDHKLSLFVLELAHVHFKVVFAEEFVEIITNKSLITSLLVLNWRGQTNITNRSYT